jgi:hypothetical protein
VRAQPEALEQPARLQLVLQVQQLRVLVLLLQEPELRLVLACWLQELPGVPAERQPELRAQQKR